MLTSRFIISLLLSSSTAVALAAETGTLELDGTNSDWKEELPASILKGTELQVVLGTSIPETSIGGAFTYKIVDNKGSFYFKVMIEPDDCYVIESESELGQNGTGETPRTYQVITKATDSDLGDGTIECAITVTSAADESYEPELKIDLLQYLDIVNAICNDDTADPERMKLLPTQIKTFKINEKSFVAVVIKDYTGSCGNNNGSPTPVGVHIFEWKYDTVEKKDKFVHAQHLPLNLPTGIEFFYDGVESYFLFVADSTDENHDPTKSKVKSYKWDGATKFDDSADIGNGEFVAASDVKHIKDGDGNNLLVVTSRGSRLAGYNKQAKLFRYNGSTWSPLNAKAETEGAYAVTHFREEPASGGRDFIIVAEHNNDSDFAEKYGVYQVKASDGLVYYKDNIGYVMGVTKWEQITHQDQEGVITGNYLIPVNSKVDATNYQNYNNIYEWVGGTIENKFSLGMYAFTAMKYIKIGGSEFLFSGNDISKGMSPSVSNPLFTFTAKDGQPSVQLKTNPSINLEDLEPSRSLTIGWEHIQINGIDYMLRLEGSFEYGIAAQVYKVTND